MNFFGLPLAGAPDIATVESPKKKKLSAAREILEFALQMKLSGIKNAPSHTYKISALVSSI